MAGRDPKPDRHQQKTISFRIPAQLMEALRTLAKRNDHTLSQEAGLAIEAHIKGAGRRSEREAGA
jgi:predicted DNA-binding protein